EARMYGLLQAAVLLVALLGVAYARRAGWLGDEGRSGESAAIGSVWALGLVLGLATTAALYVHYVAAVFVVAVDLCLLGLWVGYRRIVAKGAKSGRKGDWQAEAGARGAVALGSARAW